LAEKVISNRRTLPIPTAGNPNRCWAPSHRELLITMDVENLVIRPAKKEDAESLAKIHVHSWRAAYRNILPDSFLGRFTYEKRIKAFHEALDKQS
jgi:hypothetical protein